MSKAPILPLVTILIGALGLIAPDEASAARYRWSASGSGLWATPGNWMLVIGPANAAGYPNEAGDIAEFQEATANRTITINEPIALGSLVISSTANVFLFGNSNGRLIFDTGSPALDRSVPVHINLTGDHTIGIPIVLVDPVSISVSDVGGRLASTGGIWQTVGSPGVTKTGPGTLLFTSLQDNTYTGTTTVREGVLELLHFSSTAMSGSLVIGSGTSTTPTAIVRLRNDDQIDDDSIVQIQTDGLFELGSNNETTGSLTVMGRVTIGNGPADTSQYIVPALSLIGGTIDIAQNSSLVLGGNTVLATSTAAATARLSGAGELRLNGATRTFDVNNGAQAVDLEIQNKLVGLGSEGIVKSGPGTLRFSTDTVNEYTGSTVVAAGRMELARVGGRSIPDTMILTQSGVHTVVAILAPENISDTAIVSLFDGAELRVDANEAIGRLDVGASAIVQIGPEASAMLTVSQVNLHGYIAILSQSVMRLTGTVATTSTTRVPTIGGDGTLLLNGPDVAFAVPDGPQAIDLRIWSPINGESGVHATKFMSGTMHLDGSSDFAGRMQIDEGSLFVNGAMPNGQFPLNGGILGGTGRAGPISVREPSAIAPGLSPGILTTGSIQGSANLMFRMELNGPAPGTGYDQIKAIGSVTLDNAELVATVSTDATPFSRATLIDNDGADRITGTFLNLPEGTTMMLGGREITITYVGGDGNDVELYSTDPVTYYLAEGATGGFFDDDVLIANPTTMEAPVTMTFLLEGGGTIVEQRTIAARSRATVHVDQIAGLEAASPSVQITSTEGVPLVVERTMFWDSSYYGGHTANAVAQPELKWVFAEGFQGFFDTYVLIANANAEPTEATITFLRENDTPVVKTVPVGAFARKTVYAGDYAEVVGRAFGIIVEATRPVIAERAMYFASQPGRLWSGGHANTGIAAPSTSWFHAEGATGSYFNTFILLSNPQDTAAHVEVRFLLDTGDEITRTKTLEARQRLTINPATEGDVRLENAALSTVVESDVPIVSERSMYWPSDAAPFGEGHNSAGMVTVSTHWGLAEGRVGGPHQFQTYILLANPARDTAEATITFLRENGQPPVVKSYTVPGTSRFNVDLATVPELQNESFGARIDVTNGIDIAVERSLYWNANGVFWAGGTNALATPVP